MKASIEKQAKKNKWKSDVATNVYYYYLQQQQQQITDKQKPSIYNSAYTNT